ncbi:hypothetical protein E2E30_09405 [Sphingomonas sp. AAP5]|uniref:hypothetical protein n=1 Tax=Sphingomonas sp. AAP5 TaxID=1523415 RepID=UPI0010571373|nr:hypothetical protein [Sphingomonas sp. AAP5]QBM75960.1 hypothetical protein E2E30_09405 [Sphingomonas sp. AAP5]
MTMDSVIAGSNDIFPALMSGLEIEFGGGGLQALARHFIEAESADFHWEARSGERWLGRFEGLDDAGEERDRVAIIGCLDAHWFVAVAIVDGEGEVDRISGLRRFESVWDAQEAYSAAR